jgi:hypothetical protein
MTAMRGPLSMTWIINAAAATQGLESSINNPNLKIHVLNYS